MCQTVSGYDCRLCLSVGKSPLGSASCSKVHGVDMLFLTVRERAIPEHRQKKTESLFFISFTECWGLIFLIESESRHNLLAEVEKHSLCFHYRNKNCLKSSANCCSTLLSFGLWKEGIGCGTHCARTRWRLALVHFFVTAPVAYSPEDTAAARLVRADRLCGFLL